jgi:hypothetical protein
MHTLIPQIEEKRQAIFVGFFGPIGVSAIFYLYITLAFLSDITVDGVQSPDAQQLGEVLTIVVWFLAICSIVVHGLSIPLGKLGFFLPRTLSRVWTSQENSQNNSFVLGDASGMASSGVLRERRKKRGNGKDSQRESTEGNGISRGGLATPAYRAGSAAVQGENGGSSRAFDEERPSTPQAVANTRTIRFPDEPIASG